MADIASSKKNTLSLQSNNVVRYIILRNVTINSITSILRWREVEEDEVSDWVMHMYHWHVGYRVQPFSCCISTAIHRLYEQQQLWVRRRRTVLSFTKSFQWYKWIAQTSNNNYSLYLLTITYSSSLIISSLESSSASSVVSWKETWKNEMVKVDSSRCLDMMKRRDRSA